MGLAGVSILTKSGRSQTHEKPERDASPAQIVMYHPSKPGPMTQTNRQKHSAPMVVCICGVGNPRRTYGLSRCFNFDQQFYPVSDTGKAGARCLPGPNCDVPPFKARAHGPNKETKAFSNVCCAYLGCGQPLRHSWASQVFRFPPNLGGLGSVQSLSKMPLWHKL